MSSFSRFSLAWYKYGVVVYKNILNIIYCRSRLSHAIYTYGNSFQPHEIFLPLYILLPARRTIYQFEHVISNHSIRNYKLTNRIITNMKLVIKSYLYVINYYKLIINNHISIGHYCGVNKLYSTIL